MQESEFTRMDRTAVRLIRPGEAEPDDFVAGTPEERIAAVRQITLNCWSIMGVDVPGTRFQRHVVRVRRPER